MTTCLVLDDIRSIRMAEGNVSLPVLPRWYSLCRNVSDALSVVRESEPFDLWVLDHDLGESTGMFFLKKALQEWPEKAPMHCVSCSDNPTARQNIVSYWENWRKHVQGISTGPQGQLHR